MIIDFHTHTFPAKIAAKAIEKLSHTSHSVAFTDGTEEGLLAHMRASGVTHSVILPVATAARQVISINDASARLNEERNGDGLISLAAMHPDFEDPRGELARVKTLGFRGIKIHPVYQGANLDGPGFLRILERCAELGLIVVTHAGLDIGFPGVVHASPAMALNALREIGGSPSRSRAGTDAGSMCRENTADRFRRGTDEASVKRPASFLGDAAGTHGKDICQGAFADDTPDGEAGGFRLILAHMGGWRTWDEVYILSRELCETGPVMIDTAFSAGNFPPLPDGYWKEEDTRMLGARTFVSIIRAFGAERVLFGSDLPWATQAETLEFIEKTDLTPGEKERILWKNASGLLGISGTGEKE